MTEVTDIYKTTAQADPTHTTALRNAWARDMQRRFTELIRVIKTGVADRDCFGLQDKGMVLQQMLPPEYRVFAFLRDPQKVEAFMTWLQEQVDKGLLTTVQFQQIGSAVEAAWTNMYVYDSYKRGVLRARWEMQKAGMDIPPLDELGISSLLSTPFHMDRVGLLFTRVFTDLKNITSAMDTQISKVLAQGLIDGDGPRLIARKLIATINGDGIDRLGITDTLGRFIPAARRAEMLARTEVIRAHHLGTIQEYRNWGLEGVKVLAEWSTAGDDRVCEKCAPMNGKIFTLDEIEPLIPFHPLCRCITIPYIEEIQKYL